MNQETNTDPRVRAVEGLRKIAKTSVLRCVSMPAIHGTLEDLGLLIPQHLILNEAVEPAALAVEFLLWADALGGLGARLALARVAAGLTQQMAATHFRVSQHDQHLGGKQYELAAIWADEAGRWCDPRTIELYAQMYDVPPEWLAGYPLVVSNPAVAAKIGMQAAIMIAGVAPSVAVQS